MLFLELGVQMFSLPPLPLSDGSGRGTFFSLITGMKRNCGVCVCVSGPAGSCSAQIDPRSTGASGETLVFSPKEWKLLTSYQDLNVPDRWCVCVFIEWVCLLHSAPYTHQVSIKKRIIGRDNLLVQHCWLVSWHSQRVNDGNYSSMLRLQKPPFFFRVETVGPLVLTVLYKHDVCSNRYRNDTQRGGCGL